MSASVLAARSLESTLGGRWSVQPLHASGFCTTWRAQGGGMTLFVKSLPLSSAAVFQAEADGLSALAFTHTVRVPQVIACTAEAEQGVAMLALEWLDLHPIGAADGERFGDALARLHLAAPPEGDGRYGWRCDNMLGGTPQRNRWSDEGGLGGWVAFFARERLSAMIERLFAAGETALVQPMQALLTALPAFFADGYRPRACLIHGDLWSGNWAMLADGTPVIYDPAVSCSDAEAELAMMELFGRPPTGFWPAYRARAGLHEGYARRRGLYQLYHLLNHALLFGGGYLHQSRELLRRLLDGV
jgi:fructosamine-3-kinase